MSHSKQKNPQAAALEAATKPIKIAFVGGGNMAQALVGGLLAQGVHPMDIRVAEPIEAIHHIFTQRGIDVFTDAADAVKQADVVVLAVKPQVMQSVLSQISSEVQNALVISIAAGIPTDKLSQWLAVDDTAPFARVVRAMPNTPALVQAGATGLFASTHVVQADRDVAAQVLSAAGMVLWVEDEAQMHGVTAVSGSGPAYFFYMMEAMIDAGVKSGLTDATARALALQTALGAAQMAITSEHTPMQLRKNVTSPNGTTQAAIEHLDANHVSNSIEQAVLAAAARSAELAAALG